MTLSNFGERLSELIFDIGKTAKEVGEEIGCGNSTISHYITGRYLPTVEMAVKLADYFKCSIDYLLGIVDKNDSTVFNVCPPFGERLIAVCEYYKISRYKLQKKTGISESVMRYWVCGKTNPSINNVVKIADALGCSIDFVLGREN